MYGYVLSPFLFLLVMDFVMRRTLAHGDHSLQREDRGRLVNLNFTDDIAFLGSIQPSLCKLTAAMGSESEKAKLRINTSKSKILCIGYVCVHIPVHIDQQPLDEVDQFTYLGSVVMAGRRLRPRRCESTWEGDDGYAATMADLDV